MAKVLLQPTEAPFIEVMAGPQKGATIPISSHLSIGRSDDNDIVIPSESVSRNHAWLEKSAGGDVTVRDKGSKNGVIINGTRIQEAHLSDGDVVQIGDFVFRYSSIAVTDLPEEALEEPKPQTPYRILTPAAGRRLVLYSALIGFLALLFWILSDDKPKPSKQAAPTPVAVSVEPDTPKSPPLINDPELKQVEAEVSRLDWADMGVREAEQYFRRGTREYLNRNFHRAIEAFQTALQIEKGHPGAKKYLSWAVQEAELEAKRNRDMAIQYFESLQYQRAIFHFREVISLMAHRPTDPMVPQAEKYIELSKRALEAADFFP